MDSQRQHWIFLIEAVQHLDTEKNIYICDLHFNQNDLIEKGAKKRLKAHAVPEFGYAMDINFHRFSFDLGSILNFSVQERVRLQTILNFFRIISMLRTIRFVSLCKHIRN